MLSGVQAWGLSVLFFAVCGLGAGRGFAAEEDTFISDAVKTQIIRAQDETVSLASMDMKDVAAKVAYWMLPNYTLAIQGAVFSSSRDQAVKQVLMTKRPLFSFVIHERQFIRKGNTIVVLGLTDQSLMVGGKLVESKNNPFTDTFVLQEGGEWHFLATTWFADVVAKPPSPSPVVK